MVQESVRAARACLPRVRGAVGLIEPMCCRLPAPLQLRPQGEASGALPTGSPASLLSLLELKFLIL